MWSIDAYNDQATYFVLDDMDDFKYHFWKPWVGCQKEIIATDKYKGKKTIKWGKPCIILTNRDILEECPNSARLWWADNMTTVFLNKPLF